MNQLITYDEASGVLRTPAFPKLGRPDFTSVRTLRKHFHSALAKLECPQSSVYGWTGVAMDPVMYALIERQPFAIPIDPGATPTYGPGFQTQQMMKTTEMIWENDRTYFQSYGNNHRACFRLLDELVRPEYKVSNLNGLTGWNSTQLESTFGKPSAYISFQNNTVFTSPFSATDTPESLFRRIEECQEVAVLGGTPYSVQQIVGNTMFLFLQSGIFPNREFEVWDALTAANKTWPSLKTFVQQAFQRKLVASSFRNTSSQMGYAPNNNAFNVFGTDDDSSVDTAATKEAPNAGTAGTTGSTLGSTGLTSTVQTSSVPKELAAAIQTIAANQQALYQHVAPLSQQMAAMAFQPGAPTMGTATNTRFNAPQVPNYVGYNGGSNAASILGGGSAGVYTGCLPGGFQYGRGGGRGRGRTYGRGRASKQKRGRTAFADYVPQGRGYGGYNGSAQANRPNPVKIHNNWNVCYSCGFDVEDGHTFQTCHFDWRKPTHDVTFTRANAQQKLAQGCDACTKGMHKTMLPTQA
jgi:hypothetical protein